MKGMKGKLLKKLKTIKPIGYLKPDRILQVQAADGFFETLSKISTGKFQQTQFESKHSGKEIINERIEEPDDIIDVAELMRDLEEYEEEETELDDELIDKENLRPSMKPKDSVSCNFDVLSRKARPLAEIDVSNFKRPDMNSGTLFDPNLLAAFEEAVNHHIRLSQEARTARLEPEILEKKREETDTFARVEQDDVKNIDEGSEPPCKARRIQKEEEEEEEDSKPLWNFELKCPPGGDESVIVYTTTLGGIRKTFEDCKSILFLLQSFNLVYFERDVSMHAEFKEELWKNLDHKAVPPRLFIRGRYIGGAAEVLTLHEQGKLRPLFDGIPINPSDGPCGGCAGVRFVVCAGCCGSHKVIADDGLSSKCSECNENGLIVCPYCC